MSPKKNMAISERSDPVIHHAGDRGQVSELEKNLEHADSPLLAACKILWRDRTDLKLYAVIGIALGLAISLLLPSFYTATARLMPPDTNDTSAFALLASVAGKSGIPASAAGDLLGMKSTGAMFLAVLQSRTMQDRLIDKFDLRKVYWLKTYYDTRRKLASRTDVSEDRKSGVITIEVTDRDRSRAAALAQGYIEELNRMVAQLTTSSAHRERVFLEERLEIVKKELDNAASQFSDFSSKNTAIDMKEQGRAMVEAAATLQGELMASQSQLRGLQTIYSDSNVRVRSLKARIAELQNQLEAFHGKAEPVSETPSDALYPTIQQLPLLGQRYASLYMKVKIEETVYETLTSQYEMARVQEAKEIPSVKVLDNPERPEKSSFPRRGLFFAAVVLGSLLIGSVLIIGRELWWEIDSREPHKAFLKHVWAEIEPSVTRLSIRSKTEGSNSRDS